MKKISGIVMQLMLALSLHAAFLIDNGETGTTINTSGGIWVTFSDGYSTISFTPDISPGQSGNYCRMLDWTLNAGASLPYAGGVTSLNANWTGEDLSAYHGIRFYARGVGMYEVALATDQTRAENNHYCKKVHISEEWTLYELPYTQFTQYWGTPSPWDPTTIYSVTFAVFSAAGNSGQIWIDNIEFYLETEEHPVPDPNIIILEPKVNQVGYLPGEKKIFAVTTDSVSAGDAFDILDASDNVVFSGTISGQPVNDTISTGEFVWKTDFSAFQESGSYKVRVNDRVSHSFLISDRAYNQLFRDALRCFYLIRCGLAEDDAVTGISRPACHTQPAQIRGSTSTMDATGGWHNADDMGLFVHEAAISIAYMLWLYEIRSETFQDLNINIPESGNGFSDLLNEAKWGLTWLLKMQKSDGTVYHKADGEPNMFDCIAPDQDPVGRWVSFQKATEEQTPSTIDAADFAGVMSQAGRVFSGLDDEFAATCLEAAEKAWTWVNVNRNIGQTDPYYPDPVSWEEFLWAEGEMARTLNSNTLRTDLSTIIDTAELRYIGWVSPQLFGYMALYNDPNASPDLKNKIKSEIQQVSNTYVTVSENSGYGVSEQWYEYWWESNENVMAKGILLLFAYEITGNTVYLDVALLQLHYILGLNSLDMCFVMSHGSNAMQHPFHWIYLVYDKSIPGWMAGGPNCYANGADIILAEVINKGTPNAKCYIDVAECDLGDWACNEGETSENGALVFLSGYFYNWNIILSSGPEKKQPLPEDITVFPSPCYLSNRCNEITFTGLPANSKLSVYNIKGDEVYRTITTNQGDITVWDLTDERQIYQGVYLFTVTERDGSIYHDRFVVIR